MYNKKVSIVLESYDVDMLKQAVLRLYELASVFDIHTQSKVSLPRKIKKFTILRSPHIDKKSREQFEIRIYKRLVVFNNTNIINLDKFIDYLSKESLHGVSYKITSSRKY